MQQPRVPAREIPVVVVAAGVANSLTGKSTREAHGIIKHTQAHPPRNQHLKGHNELVGSKGSEGKWGESLIR